MTETSPAFISTPKDFVRKSGSSGWCTPNSKIRVVDPETKRALGPNQKGEICIKGPQVFHQPIQLGFLLHCRYRS